MKKIMLSLIAGICLAGFSALSFADEMGQMKEEMKVEIGKMKEDMKGEKEKMKSGRKGKADELKGKDDSMKKKEESMKGEMKGWVTT